MHQQVTIKPENIPDRSAFKDYRKYFIQDIELKRHNTLFRLERWKTAEGKYLKACLPKEYQGFHFGPNLRVFILQQYYQARVTQSKLLEQLTSWNIEISEGELNHIISSYTPEIEKELNAMLGIALKESNYIQTDDTGARHKGKNQVCLQVGNKLFTYLTTGVSKSRLRFLELLNQKKQYL